VTVNTNSLPTNNIIVAIATQTSDDTVFTPTWDASTLTSSLITIFRPAFLAMVISPGGPSASLPPAGSLPPVLTDGNFRDD